VTRLLIAVCALAAGFCHAEDDWQRDLTPAAPGAFPAMPDFRAKFVFGWSDLIEAAEAQADLKREGNLLKIHVEGRTLGLARALWKLDATHDAVIDAAAFRPVEFHQTEKYSNRSIETKVRFTPGVVSRFRQVSIDPPDKARWKKLDIKDAFDILGGLLFVRSQPLHDGDAVRLIDYPGESPYYVTVKSEGKDRIEVMGKMRDAIRLNLSIRKIETKHGKLDRLVPHSNFSSGQVWVSDDDQRLPLRAEVNVFIGFVYGELLSIEFP